MAAAASSSSSSKAWLLTLVWSASGSFIILKVIDMIIGLRVSEDIERDGLDLGLHGETVQ